MSLFSQMNQFPAFLLPRFFPQVYPACLLAREFFWGKHLLKKISTDCLKSLIPFRALLINPIGMDNNVKCSALCVRTLKEDSSRNNRAPHKQRENESNHIVLLRALHIL